MQQISTYGNVIPLCVVQIVLVDSQLGSGQRHSSHLVLQAADLERAGNDVVEQQLEQASNIVKHSNN